MMDTCVASGSKRPSETMDKLNFLSFTPSYQLFCHIPDKSSSYRKVTVNMESLLSLNLSMCALGTSL